MSNDITSRMQRRRKTYDDRCFVLACHFLEGNVTSPEFSARAEELASAIQSAIEDWLASEQPR